jgi:hypothetical protein
MAQLSNERRGMLVPANRGELVLIAPAAVKRRANYW